MVRPATSSASGSVQQAKVPDEHLGTESTDVAETLVVGTAPDLETSKTAEARVQADPIARQHQLKISAKLDAKVDPETAARLVRVGHKISHAIYDKGSALATRGAEALGEVGRITGRRDLVTHGTVERSGNRFVYRDEPKDKLVVPSENGGTRTFAFDKIEGNLSSYEAFFGGDHNFSFHVTESDGTDLDVVTKKKGSDHDVTVSGTIPYDGKKYEADIRYRGTETRENDSTGSSYKSTATYTGIVKGNGMTLTVEEKQQYSSMSAVRTDGIGGSATSTTREINNRLEVGKDTYRWKGCRTNQTFRNGVASNQNRGWAASGELYRNDELLGTYQLGVRQNVIAFELDIGGERHEIDRFNSR